MLKSRFEVGKFARLNARSKDLQPLFRGPRDPKNPPIPVLGIYFEGEDYELIEVKTVFNETRYCTSSLFSPL